MSQCPVENVSVLARYGLILISIEVRQLPTRAKIQKKKKENEYE